MNIFPWESCVQSGCCLLTVDQKLQCHNCFNTTKRISCCCVFIFIFCDDAWNLDPPLHSRVKSAVIWVDSSRWKPSKVIRRKQQARFRPTYFGMHKVFCSLVTLRKEEPSNSEYYEALLMCLKEEPPQCHKWRKVLFHQDNSLSQVDGRKYMNCTLNHFCTHPILLIWPPVTTGCLQTLKECSRERDLASMKKWYWKLRNILWPKASNC